ncbi:allophanate hydrolase [Pontibacillus chungwhensis BH030062]|uniref:Allophanate hydrolase n=1 Tax=Pontibacillus chungwhensis BH030062 TaxID=1385513 RepID=A0A0A2VFV7_9BACI|nr:5-oxoprolinase subunit PxpB [Pontibacillus chungwhensis]KGP92520.1 allophanate hydrolase [Pontibacillus chungwhensis BH030062]
MRDIQYVPFGENGIKIVFPNHISQEIHERILKLYQSVKRHTVESITDIVPSYTVLTVYFNETLTSFNQMKEKLESIWASADARDETPSSRVVTLPVYYGGEVGEDLPKVASANNFSQEDVINLHSSRDYLTYMIGFLPGFPYLGGMDERIATPRLEKPRGRVEAGSVGIAGSQTGVYPIGAPGGWNIIGQTPIPIVDFTREEPFLIEMGDYIRFRPVQHKEYEEIKQRIKNGSYTIEIVDKEA